MYEKLISSIELKNEAFKFDEKEMFIVAPQHNEIALYNRNYVKPNNQDSKIKSPIKIIYDKILNYIFKEALVNDSNIMKSQLRDVIQADSHVKVALQKLISTINQRKVVEVLPPPLDNLFFKLVSKNLNLESFLKFINSLSLTEKEHHDLQINKINRVSFGTIHSVKGETHKATLLVNSIFREGFNEQAREFSLFNLIENNLLGEYISLDSIDETQKKSATSKALKLAYVALSRPTTLAVIAINKNDFINETEDKRQRIKIAGWKIY